MYNVVYSRAPSIIPAFIKHAQIPGDATQTTYRAVTVLTKRRQKMTTHVASVYKQGPTGFSWAFDLTGKTYHKPQLNSTYLRYPDQLTLD